MNVVAKMRVVEKSERSSNYGEPKKQDGGFVKLAAVQGEENKTWTQWTPSGGVELHITNPAALEAFVVGKDYLVTFTPEV